MCRQALAISTNLLKGEVEVAWSLEQLASVLEAQGNLEDALAGLRKSLAILKRQWGYDPAVTGSATRLADVLAKVTRKLSTEGRFAEAEAVNQECLTEIQGQKFRDDWWISGMQADLGASLLAQGKMTEAEPLLLDGYEGLKRCEYHI